MKFFIINNDYGDFIKKEYKNNKGLIKKSFDEQLQHRYDTLFGLSNFYSKNLTKLGHQAIDIIANHNYIQKQWAKENGLQLSKINNLLSSLPILRRFFKANWLEDVLHAQILKYKPDVIYSMGMEEITSNFLNKIKKEIKVFIVGQHAAPINDSMKDLSAYDLIFSSLPNHVEFFKSKGKKSEYLQLAFEKTIQEKLLQCTEKEYDVVYIGGFGEAHSQRNKLLEFLAKQNEFKIDFWGYGANKLSKDSPILNKFHGFTGGLDMYNILNKSKICINGHINISGDFANNMRLYESTGVGTLLITDSKKNIGDIFEVNKEIITYSDEFDLKEKILYFK